MVSVKDGPHDANPDGFTERIAPAGVTLLVSTTAAETGGAHLNESVALPWPVEWEKVMVIGLVVQMTFGVEELEETAAT